MYLIIVYDTEKRNCAILHRHLKRYLHWNQNSVFEGNVTVAQYQMICTLLEEIRAEGSSITLYTVDSEKLLRREELGASKGNTSNIL